MTQNDEEIDFQKVVWTHLKSGDRYQIMNFGLRERDLEPMVIYAKEGFNGPCFIRTCMEFFDGRFVNVAVDGDMEREPKNIEVKIVATDVASEVIRQVTESLEKLSPEDVQAMINAEGQPRPEPMSLELFQTKAGEFLAVKGDFEERERRKLVVKAICATFGVQKWTDIPVRGREDAMMALNAYIEDMMRADAQRKSAAQQLPKSSFHNTEPAAADWVEGAPPLKDRASDMKGVSILPGEYVELASLLSADRKAWGEDHYRKVQMVEPDGTVILEGEGDNRWQDKMLLVKSHLDI